MEIDTKKLWRCAHPIVDSLLRPRDDSLAAHRFLKKFGLFLPNIEIAMKVLFVGVKDTEKVDLAGYMLFALTEITGHQLGFYSIGLTNKGDVIRDANTGIKSFREGEELIGCSIRISDPSPHGDLHIARNPISAIAIAIITGKRVWSPVMPIALQEMVLPPVDRVCFWNEASKHDAGLDTNGMINSAAQAAIHLSGVSEVVLYDLKSNANVKFTNWASAFSGMKIGRHESYEKRLALAQSLSDVSSFSKYTDWQEAM